MATLVATAGVNTKDVFAKATALLKGVSTEKAMRMFNRTVGDNIKLDKFLSGEFKLPRSFDPESVSAQIDRLVNPEKSRNPHQHFGLIAVAEQRAILNSLVEEKVNEEVNNKTVWLQGFALNEEQQLAGAKALEAYKKTLMSAIKTVSRWKQVYGTEE